jgi:ubiquinone biosynthesis protein Coq4
MFYLYHPLLPQDNNTTLKRTSFAWQKVRNKAQRSALKKIIKSQAWRCTPVMLTIEKLRQEDEASLGYIVRPYLKKQNKTKVNKAQTVISDRKSCLGHPGQFSEEAVI